MNLRLVFRASDTSELRVFYLLYSFGFPALLTLYSPAINGSCIALQPLEIIGLITAPYLCLVCEAMASHVDVFIIAAATAAGRLLKKSCLP